MILITAATGQIGSTALSAVASAGSEVRALIRDPSKFTAPQNVQVAKGNFDDEASLAAALDGVTVMLLAGRDSPDSVAQHRRVLAAAKTAGVRHIVKLSAIGASSESPVALMREHHEVDEIVRDGSASWTFLKPHLFMQNLLRAGEAVRNEGRLRAPMGQNRFPLVDTRDVGVAAAAVMLDPDVHAGKTYALTGPEALSYGEVAAAFSAVAGRAVAYEPVAPESFEAGLLAIGLPDWRAFDLAHIASAYGPDDNVVTPDLALLLGRPPLSLEAFLEDHQGAFSA